MIVNRNDYHQLPNGGAFGVGHQLFSSGSCDPGEVELVKRVLRLQGKHFGDGVVALDCGANIGVHAVEWGKLMHGWGRVLAFEAQERIYYALAGNIAINNVFNVSARNVALTSESGTMKMPALDYTKPASYGSLEVRKRDRTENIGQIIDYTKLVDVQSLALDSLRLERVDFIKIDVEGMELDVLEGAKSILSRFRPPVLVEVIKSDQVLLRRFMHEAGYLQYEAGINWLCVHQTCPFRQAIRIQG
jgi:FkbM family methyltransferase